MRVFWRDYQAETRRRSRLEGGNAQGADLLDHSLAFLANNGATSDFRHFAVGALIFVATAILRQGAVEPEVREAFLASMLRNRDRLSAFASTDSRKGDFEDAMTLPRQPRPVTLQGTTTAGCFDLAADEIKVAVMIKTATSPAKGRRCQ